MAAFTFFVDISYAERCRGLQTFVRTETTQVLFIGLDWVYNDWIWIWFFMDWNNFKGFDSVFHGHKRLQKDWICYTKKQPKRSLNNSTRYDYCVVGINVYAKSLPGKLN
jgi:hypothetical protein